MFDDYKKIVITRNNGYCWYNVGEIYEVKPYRYNRKEYWEVKGWDGNNCEGIWIRKDHSEICEPYDWIDKLFE